MAFGAPISLKPLLNPKNPKPHQSGECRQITDAGLQYLASRLPKKLTSLNVNLEGANSEEGAEGTSGLGFRIWELGLIKSPHNPPPRFILDPGRPGSVMAAWVSVKFKVSVRGFGMHESVACRNNSRKYYDLRF